jgi:hypothetical protein
MLEESHTPVFFFMHVSEKNIASKRYQIIAVETMMQSTYAIASENRREEWRTIRDLGYLPVSGV